MPRRLQNGLLASVLLLLGAMPSCAPPVPSGGFGAPDPASRIYAAVGVAEEFDQTGVRPDETTLENLVKMLVSADPAERFIAGNTLQLVTGQDLGFDASAPFAERTAAAERWADWIGEGAPVEPGRGAP